MIFLCVWCFFVVLEVCFVLLEYLVGLEVWIGVGCVCVACDELLVCVLLVTNCWCVCC